MPLGLHLAGWSALQVLGLFAGVGAGVVVLYLLKLRRRRVAVPFVQLWEQLLADRPTSRLFSSLSRWFSLLIALLVALALSLALGDPQAGPLDDERHWVVLLDTSASMRATDVEPNRLAFAKRRVEGLVRQLGARDRMLLAQMGETTFPITPFTDRADTLLAALTPVQPTDGRADLDAALRFARDALRGSDSPHIVLVSDGRITPTAAGERALAEVEAALHWIRVGQGGRNLAISAFAVRRYPLDRSRGQCLIELWNPTERDEVAELTLVADGRTVDMQQLSVGAGARVQRILDDISGVDQTLEARLAIVEAGADRQPADDRAYARVARRERVKVQVVSEGNLYLQAALLLDEYLDVVETKPADYTPLPDAQVAIFDSFVPSTPPSVPVLYLNPASDSEAAPFPIRGTVERPYFDRLVRDHPILRWTALRDVNVKESLAVRLQAGDRVIAGDRGRGGTRSGAAGSRAAPLLVAGERAGQPMVALLFDPRKSDLPLRVAWPLLLLNTIRSFLSNGGEEVSSFRVGEPWRVAVDPDARTATVATPTGERLEVPVVDGRPSYRATRAGFYRLEAAGSAPETVAVQPDLHDEPLMQPAETFAVGSQSASPPRLRGASWWLDPWKWLVLAALTILAIEWLTYHRRWTV